MLKFLKRIFYATCLMVCQANLVLADEDLFAPSTEKVNKFNTYMTGTWAIGIFTLVIGIAAFAFLFGYLSKKWALSIVGAMLLLGSGASVVSFFLG